MARRDDLDIFAKEHNLKTVFISDIVEYRLANEMLIQKIDEEEIEFFGVNVIKSTFKDHRDNEHTAIQFYTPGEIANVKVHNVIPDIELLLNQARYSHLISSIEYLKTNSGVLLFINQPDNESSNMKDYGIGAQILKSIGISKMHLLHSGSVPDFVGISGFGLEVADVISV
jgi:3,4-dihydroxy 2-butanone 4-phosphate synthase/GTP cyclohydrolase II